MNYKKLLFAGALGMATSLQAQYSWQGTVVNASYHLYTIDAPADDAIYVGGYGGSLLKSTDGGLTWQNLYINAEYITDIVFTDAQHGWVCAQASMVANPGKLHKTSDGGSTWELVQQTADYLCMDWIDASNGYVGGWDGFLEKTTDGGTTWTVLTLPSAHTVASIDFVDAAHGFVSTTQHDFYRTSDGGQTWESFSHPYIESVFFRDQTNGFCTTYYGKIGKTTDGGQTFTYYQSPYNFTIREVFFTDAFNGFAVGGLDCSSGNCLQSPILLTTTDGGTTWIDNSHPYMGMQRGFFQIAVTPGGKPFISGSHQIVLSVSGTTGIDEPSANALGIHPNPAADRIQFNAPKGAAAAILADETGRFVQQFAIQPGADEISLDISSLSPGMYFLSIADATSATLSTVRLIKSLE